MTPTIKFGPNADPQKVPPYALKVLSEILLSAGLSSVVISSTQRAPFDQARVMFDNLEKTSVAAQKSLYGPNGDKVIDVYVAAKKAGKAKSAIIEEMKQKVIELGPYNVSHHASDPAVMCVFDVAPSSVPSNKKAAFETAVKSDKRVSKFITPPSDPGYHLEIPKPK
jgi:hypothetical protein